MSKAVELKEKLESKDATIAVIGQGYVGLPLALGFVEAGFRTIGVDIDADRVAQLNEGSSYISDISDEELQDALETGRFSATTDFADVAEADAVSICVPTPLRKTRDPDISYIQSATESIRPHLKETCLIVLESTTYPGTTEEVLAPMLADGDGDLSDGRFVAFSPERVDPGNKIYQIHNTPKVVGGVNAESTELAVTLYSQMLETVHAVGSATEAEMVKLLENTFRAVNIGLVNELAVMCDRMEINIWRVIEAAATKPFGYMPFYPGPGIGGHCIPLDPTYLSWKAKSFGFYNRFIELATDINSNMPRFVVQKLARALNDHKKPINGSKVLLVGMAYKPDVHDTRESPALDIWQLLKEEGAELAYHDPFVPKVRELDGVESVELTAERLADSDAVLICTNHSDVDYELIVENAPLVLDTRDAIEGVHESVVQL
ncbi:MAG: nucleotide sugar dehydrogenase [Persicimonas sp.]